MGDYRGHLLVILLSQLGLAPPPMVSVCTKYLHHQIILGVSHRKRRNGMSPSLPGTPETGSTENPCLSETLLDITVNILGGPHQTVNSNMASGLISESKNFVEMENEKG